ncbi:hypothetical protein V5N11_036364 [Cardamine amara subsp. amara]|uniref:Uncharacterized protein n=1 Tax=Cardamine amara subsp. amara TaxID=228776 RepID=A0ABD1AKA9_CARAN
MATNVNQLESDLLLPPRKRLLAGYKKQNSMFINGGDQSVASSSSTTTSNSSSASTDVQTHLDNLLRSQLNDQSQSPEELVHSSKATAALAANAAKAARAKANEKAMIASKAVAAAKNALELFASFPSQAVGSKEKSPKKNKQKKHVPVQLFYSNGVADEDLSRRLNRVMNDCSGHRNKKQKSLVTYENSSVTSTMYDGVDVAGVVDSDSSVDEEVDRTRVNGKLLLCDNPVKEKTGLRVKLKLLPLSMCASKDQENGITKSPVVENNVGVSKLLDQLEGSDGGVAQVVAEQDCSLIVSEPK